MDLTKKKKNLYKSWTKSPPNQIEQISPNKLY